MPSFRQPRKRPICLPLFLALAIFAPVGVTDMQFLNGQEPSAKVFQDGVLEASVDFKLVYAKKLLEFADNEQQSNLKAAMIYSLAQAGGLGNDSVNAIAIEYSRNALDTVRSERQMISLERIEQLKSVKRDATTSARARAIRVELDEMVLQLQKRSADIRFEREEIRTINRLRAYEQKPIEPLQAATGNSQNFLLDAMSSRILEFGYSLDNQNQFEEANIGLTLSEADFQKIRLKFLTQTGWIEFPLLEGSGVLEAPPFLLRQSGFEPQIEQIEQQFAELSQIGGGHSDFVALALELESKVDALESEVGKLLGNGHFAARKGKDYYSKWSQVRDYITGLNAVVNNIQISNDTAILKSRYKYDPKIHGDSVLPLATFCISNSCQFAPASDGDSATYVRLQRSLMRLHSLLAE